MLFWLVYYFTLGNGVVLAYLVSAISPNMEAANAILPTYVVTLLFFAGWLIRRDDIPAYWSWYYYVDLMRYSFGALIINQWEDNDPMWAGGQTLLDAYDPALRAQLRACAADAGVRLSEGVYLAGLGPSFETPAEIRAFKVLGRTWWACRPCPRSCARATAACA